MVFDLGHSKVFLREDGIVQVNCTEHTYTMIDIKEINDAKRLINKGQKSCLLVIVHPFANIENEARDFMAQTENTDNSVAEAFVLRSIAQKLLANFYLKMNRPAIPTRFFSNREEAILWLKGINE